MTNAGDIDLIDLYTRAQQFQDKKKNPNKKSSKIVKTTRNNQLVDNLTVRRGKTGGTVGDNTFAQEEKKKRSNERKPKLDTLPHDLTTAINMGTKMITKFNKRSRMKCNNLFTSSTTPTGHAVNSLKATINNSMNQNSFRVNKSFFNKMPKKK